MIAWYGFPSSSNSLLPLTDNVCYIQAGIDTKACPVYMLTGEYDWSNTPAMSQATCDKIPGAKHKAIKGVGHFPATENPKVFVPSCEFWSCVL